MEILIVDDSFEAREAIKNIIKLNIDSSITVFEAKDGKEALNYLKYKSIDILFTDIMMPEMDGFELIKRVRAYAGKADIFIVAITGLSGDEQIKKLFDNGVDYYIPKPIQQDDIVARLKLIIRLINKEKTLSVLSRDNINPFNVSAMMNYFTTFVILQEEDLYKILHHIALLYPKANKIILKDFLTMLLKSYESLEGFEHDVFEIILEPSSDALYVSCYDLPYMEVLKEYEQDMPLNYEVIYMPHGFTIEIPTKS